VRVKPQDVPHNGRFGHTLVPMGEHPKARFGVTLLRYGLPAVVAILLLAPRTPAPPDPPHIDERDDYPAPTEIMIPMMPPLIEPQYRPPEPPPAVP
jgi:hypothetical protein